MQNQKLPSVLLHKGLINRIRGCLVGAHVGDCIAKPFKLAETVSKLQLQKYMDKLDGVYFKAPYMAYSVNTGFSNCLGESLVDKKSFDPVDVSRRFAKEFFTNPQRDYGSNITKIMLQLRGKKFADPYEPAKEQYLGLGSFGNKAAARVAPIVFFHLDDELQCRNAVIKASQITHTNKLAIDGALLQSWAIRLALEEENSSAERILTKLFEYMEGFSKDAEDIDVDHRKYHTQIALVEKLLSKDSQTEEEIVNILGHGKTAVYSIPTSLFCFLRSLSEVPGITTDNAYRRSIQLAVSLGGDADTIASMTGCLAGAYHGLKAVGETMQRHCEGIDRTLDLANDIIESLCLTDR